MSLPRAVLVVNRAARAAGGFAWEPAVLTALGARWRVELVRPATPAEGAAAAREAAAAGAAVVIAAGGDGTLHVIADALAGGDVPLGVLPLGTANDFARALGIPRDVAAAAAHLAAAVEPRRVDVVAASGTTICSVGGLGVVSAGARRANELRAGRGALPQAMRATRGAIYKLAASATLLTRAARARGIDVRWRDAGDGAWRELREEAHGVFVANQRYLGAGLALPHVAPSADGAFELLVVREATRAQLLAAFTRLSLGLPIPAERLHVLRATAAEIRCDEPDVLLADGDIVSEGRAFTFSARAGALRVLG